MAANKDEIRGWLKQAKKEKATHVVVVCDTFSYEDYPVSVKKGEDVLKAIDAREGKNMQQVMEVYNLSMNIEEQLAEHRAWHT